MSEERAVSEALCRNNWSGYAAVCAEVCGDCSVPGQPHPCEHAMAVWGTDAQAILRALSSHAPNPAVERPQDIVERLREQYAEQFKDEQPAEVIYRYQQERFEAADEITRLRSAFDQLHGWREAIEAAAKECESVARWFRSYRKGAERCAARIRSLSPAPKDREGMAADDDAHHDAGKAVGLGDAREKD